MATREPDNSWLPVWVSTLNTPVWVAAPDRSISYVNGHAETLLGRSSAECVGLPCYQVVAARDASGRPFCGPCCLLFRLAGKNRSAPPVELRLGHSDGRTTWISVLTIAVRAPGGEGPWLVHCALNTDRAHRLEDYLTKVALRTSSKKPKRERIHDERRVEGVWEARRDRLTKRESEILQLLAEDPDLRNVAMSLCISYSTVRNHVQHILPKLGVHSINEAVAYHVLLTK